jgi:uncharacterized repeat protein (TIGR03803 family)
MWTLALRFGAMAALVAMSGALVWVPAGAKSVGSSTTFRVVHAFSAASRDGAPIAPLTLGTDGRLYGLTLTQNTMGGVAYALSTRGAYTVLHRFGKGPEGYGSSGLVPGPQGLMYAATAGGSAYGRGALFSLDPRTGAATVLHAFAGAPRDGGGGSSPLQVAGDGTIYGFTAAGGANGWGTVFAYDTVTTNYRIVYDFHRSDGNFINGVALTPSGLMVGTALGGGFPGRYCSIIPGCGTLFSVSGSGTFTMLHEFSGLDRSGRNPNTVPVVDASGRIFGSTSFGGGDFPGAGDVGTIYRVDGRRVSHVFSFPRPRGRHDSVGASAAGFTVAGNFIYAPSTYVGTYGSILRISMDGSYAVFYAFRNLSDGSGPYGLLAAGNALYGMSSVAARPGRPAHAIVFALTLPPA